MKAIKLTELEKQWIYDAIEAHAQKFKRDVNREMENGQRPLFGENFGHTINHDLKIKLDLKDLKQIL